MLIGAFLTTIFQKTYCSNTECNVINEVWWKLCVGYSFVDNTSEQFQSVLLYFHSSCFGDMQYLYVRECLGYFHWYHFYTPGLCYIWDRRESERVFVREKQPHSVYMKHIRRRFIL